MRSLSTVPLLVVAFVAAACSGSDSEADRATRQSGPATRLGSARLQELDLTYDVPPLVREACAGASRQATVRVICPSLVPDVPLTRSVGLWGSVVPHDDPRFYMLTFNNGESDDVLVHVQPDELFFKSSVAAGA